MKTENKVLIGFVGIFIVTSALVGTVLVARAKYTGSASEPTIVQGNKIFAADSAPETVNKATIIPTTPYLSFASDAVNAKEENANVISIQFFGDMMLDRNVAKVMGTKGLDYLFANVQGEKRIFGDADLLIANLEGPFASKRVATSKSIAFRFDPKLAEQLKKYGFDGVSLANNHSYDMGRANVAFTRETLKKAGVGYFGDELLEG
ncbi:MAG TPA: CapA family protein, partial [Patescibacteria group bacterium]|nr:CapA family protein [Patescibacteria group bacterium]